MNRSKGSISVFMVFVLFIMLAATGTLLEGSRYYAVRTFSKNIVGQAADSVKTEYYRPLLDEYHLLFMAADGGEEQQKIALEERLKYYLKYSLMPGDEIAGWNLNLSKLNQNLCTPCLEKLEVQNISTAVDKGIFEKEAAAYMKYKSLDEVLGEYLSKFKFSETLGKTAKVLSKKMDTEQTVGKLSSEMLTLMKLVDGISADRYGVNFSQNGKVQTEQYFAKKFVPGQVSQQSVSINNTLMWTSLKNNYINVDDLLYSIQIQIVELQKINTSVEELQKQYNSITQSEEFKEDEKTKLLEEIEASLDSQTIKLNDKTSNIKSNLFVINSNLAGVENAIKKAIDIIPCIKEKEKEAKDSIAQYRTVLEGEKSGLSADTYDGLNKDCEALEKYVGIKNNSDSSVNSIMKMQTTLESNLEILQKLKGLKNMDAATDKNKLEKLSDAVASCRESLHGYNIQDLQFDYSTVQFDRDKENPLTSVKKMLNESLFDLVIYDTSSISKNSISNANYLANKYAGDHSESTSEIGEKIKNLENDSETGELFKNMGGTNEEFIWSTLSSTTTRFLVNQYFKEHYHNYTSTERKENQAFHYEEEYILNGKNSDKENLEGTITKLVLWRTVLNFISILGDGKKGDIAYAAAAAIVGFTGMEPLVRILKTFILLVWAFDEALLDASALLDNQSISALKEGSKFQIEFSDIFILNKELIHKKIQKEKKENAILLKYEDYLQLFLLLGNQQSFHYRAMDLINENMRVWYNDKFDMEMTVYSYEVSAYFKARYRFMFLPQKTIFTGGDKSLWKIETTAFSCYM